MKLSRVLGGAGLAVGVVGGARPDPEEARADAQLPGDRARALLAGDIGPELRQYIVTGNDEERPFSRDQRSWIYASSKQENNYSGFGTDNDIEHLPGYAIIKHRTFAASLPARPRGEDRAAQRQGPRRSARPAPRRSGRTR